MTNSTSKHSVKDLLRRAIRIEHQAGDIYREYVRRFSHHAEVAALWETLAAEEDIHARVLTEVLQNALPEKLAGQVSGDMWENIVRIERLMHQASAQPVGNLKEAYDLAHQLEYSEVNAVFEFLSINIVPGQVEREFVRTHIAMHQKRLVDFSREYVGENWVDITAQ